MVTNFAVRTGFCQGLEKIELVGKVHQSQKVVLYFCSEFATRFTTELAKNPRAPVQSLLKVPWPHDILHHCWDTTNARNNE